eukprot:CCRYP_000096-RD/>CCRYP_000096-RD protein AED:0.49 eAED:0.49 QI:0/-1/0/1/-1/0/1/0/15
MILVLNLSANNMPNI